MLKYKRLGTCSRLSGQALYFIYTTQHTCVTASNLEIDCFSTNLSPIRSDISKSYKNSLSVGDTHHKIRQLLAEEQLPSKHGSSNANLDEAVGGKWTTSAICLSDRRAGTYMSLQIHMTGRFNTLPPRPFLPRAALPVYFPSTNFIRTSMDACKEEVTFFQLITQQCPGHDWGPGHDLVITVIKLVVVKDCVTTV